MLLFRNGSYLPCRQAMSASHDAAWRAAGQAHDALRERLSGSSDASPPC
jgi:hypothetical protein